MSPLEKIGAERRGLIAESNEMYDLAEKENREPTSAERTKLDANKARLDQLALREKRELDRMIPNASPIIQTGPWPGETEEMIAEREATRRRLIGGGTTSPSAGKIGAKYRDLFGAQLSADGWKSPNEFYTAVHAGVHHPRLYMAMGESSGSDGGFLVPTQYASEMLDAAIENSIVAKRARIYPMTGETLKVAGFDASTNASNTLFGGITAQWLSESETGTATNPKVRKIELKARKLALFVTSSNEIAEDGINFESQLNEALRVANVWFSDFAFLRGTGAGQPLGVLNDPALVTQDKAAQQAADTIVYANLCAMLSRLHPSCFANSVWVANPTCIPQLLQLTITIGTSGAHIPAMRSTDGGGFEILTRPVLFSEKLPVVGDVGDIILADFSQYAIGVRKDVTIEKSGHVYFHNDETAWRAITRLDGMGRWSKAFTPATGSTQSWCVALAAR